MDIRNKLDECTVIIMIEKQELGSGFLIGQGLVLTCQHVISDMSSVNDLIVVTHGASYTVKMVNKAKEFDVAILETDIQNREYLPIGFCNEPEIDEKFYTCGMTCNHPDGESRTFRYEGKADKGLIKCKDGEVEPGMSGGAILSMNSNLVCGVLKSTKGEGTNLGGYIVPLNYEVLSSFPDYLFEAQFCFGDTNFGSVWLNEIQYRNFETFWSRFKSSSDIRKEILQKIQKYYKGLYNLRVSGSWKIRVGNLFSDNMLMKFEGMNEVNENIQDLEEYALEKLENKFSRGLIIISPPGYGKTTFTYALLRRFLSTDDLLLIKKIPLFIDMSTYTERDIEEFGTEKWLESYLKTNYGIGDEHYRYLMSHKEMLLIFFESIDEFLSVYSLDMVYRRFDMDLFRKMRSSSKLIFSCRLQNFDNYIGSIPLIMQMDVIRLSPFTDVKIKKYMKYYFRLNHTKTKTKKQISHLVFQTPDIHALAKTPLQLNMIFSLIEGNCLYEGMEITLRSFYEQFIDLWIRHENAVNYPHVLSYDEKIQFLERIAWYFFEENHSDTRNGGFTKDKLIVLLKKYVSDNRIDKVMNEILNRTFLMQKKNFSRTTINFLHKSFQEYFVASYFFRAVNENIDCLAVILQNYLSSYVSEFFKEFMQECSLEEKRILTKNLKCTYEKNICDMSDLEYGKKRIAREQIAYSLGVIGLKESNDYLELMLKTEIDVWVRRGIYIGLAFGGNEVYRNKYVEILRNEREKGDTSIENECNIGYMLTFFGDQPLDIEHPDQDRGEAKCGNMVDQMLVLFQNETDFPAWRLHLYTLIDMYKYRMISRDNMVRSLKNSYQQYNNVLNNMKSDSRCKEWPEIKEFIEILKTIEECL